MIVLATGCDDAHRDSTGTFKNELSYYQGKPLAVLLDDVESPVVKKFLGDEPPGKLSYVWLKFENGVEVTGYFQSITYQDAFNLKSEWDFELAKKEIVSRYELSE